MERDSVRRPQKTCHVKPAPISHEYGRTTTIVSWVDSSSLPISLVCRERLHIILDCRSPITAKLKIVSNYEKLTADKNLRLHDTYCHVVLSRTNEPPEYALVSVVKKAEQPKKYLGGSLILESY